MNRNVIVAGLVILVVLVGVYFFRMNAQTKSANEAQNTEATSPAPKTSKVVESVYTGKLPCADCEGIQTELTLFEDLTYSLSNTYLGKSVEPFVEDGKWTYVKGDANDDNATVVQLYDQTTGEKRNENYLMQGDKLVPLDNDMKQIDSPFDMSLTKKTSK